LTRFAGNMAYISYNFWNLPRRDPAERLNQAKHIVVWVESLTIFFACLTVTNLLLWMAGKKLCGKTLHRLCQWLKGLGKFSVLLSLKYFNPMNMIDFMKKMQKKSAHKVVWELFLIAMCVPTAILSIMIKIAQVDFITEKFYWDWTIWNWFALAGFINNLASLITNKDKVQIDAIFLFITANDVESPEKWHAALGDALYEQYGKGGLILMSCVNAEDVGILLNTRSCLESSDRLFELVPQSGCQQLALR